MDQPFFTLHSVVMGLRTRNRLAAGGGGGGVGSVSAAWGQQILNLVHGEAAERIASAAVVGQRMELVRGRHASVVPVFGIDKGARAHTHHAWPRPIIISRLSWIVALRTQSSRRRRPSSTSQQALSRGSCANGSPHRPVVSSCLTRACATASASGPSLGPSHAYP